MKLTKWRAIPNTGHSSDTEPDTLIVLDEGDFGPAVGLVKPEFVSLVVAAPDMVEALSWLAVELETLANTHGDPNAAYLLNESGAMAALKKAGVLE